MLLKLIDFVINFFGMFYSILAVSSLVTSLSLLFYYYRYEKVSFFLLYVSLTYNYFFVLSSGTVSPITATYGYYFFIFLFYHLYFTASKRFYSRTIVVIKSYLNGSEYFKLILWIVLVFITALFGEAFIFLMVFTPLLGFSLVTENFTLLFFLLIQWIWLIGLIFTNTFNIFTNFLSKIQKYFSRKACLHYIGNNPGAAASHKIGTYLVWAPVTLSVPAGIGYAFEKEVQTGNHAIGRMHDFQATHPDSTHNEQYRVYKACYTSHGNSSMVGRGLTKSGFMSPAAPESIIPSYKSELRDALSDLEKK
jgi:hypothetical protein